MKHLLKTAFLILLIGCSSSKNNTSTVRDALTVKVQYSDGWDMLNTFDSTYIRDNDLPSRTTYPMNFTSEEQSIILQAADKIDFWGLPDVIPINPENPNMIILPASTIHAIRIKTQDKDKAIKWRGGISDSLISDRIWYLIHTIGHTLRSKPEYRLIPRHRGRL